MGRLFLLAYCESRFTCRTGKILGSLTNTWLAASHFPARRTANSEAASKNTCGRVRGLFWVASPDEGCGSVVIGPWSTVCYRLFLMICLGAAHLLICAWIFEGRRVVVPVADALAGSNCGVGLVVPSG